MIAFKLSEPNSWQENLIKRRFACRKDGLSFKAIPKLIQSINEIISVSNRFSLPITNAYCVNFKIYLKFELDNYKKFSQENRKPPSKEIVLSKIMDILRAFRNEIEGKKFAYIESNKAGFFEQEKLFGKDVFKSFKSARADIKDSGNCIAADLNTAAVFHLMRVVERGLRAFARELQVAIPNSELEYKNWQTIIDQFPKAIEAKLNKKMSPKRRSELLEFYSGVTGQFEFFKDVWRNHCAHARGHYDALQAQSAFDHVKLFMQRLATRVSETKH